MSKTSLNRNDHDFTIGQDFLAIVNEVGFQLYSSMNLELYSNYTSLIIHLYSISVETMNIKNTRVNE